MGGVIRQHKHPARADFGRILMLPNAANPPVVQFEFVNVLSLFNPV
jgi:hypothetical protein